MKSEYLSKDQKNIAKRQREIQHARDIAAGHTIGHKLWRKFTVYLANKFSFFSSKNNLFDWEEFEKNVQYKILPNGEKVKIAAEINDVQLSFTNPSRPGEKNKVLRGPSLQIYEGKVHAIIGESGSGKSVITSLLYGLTGDNAVIDSGK
ncbi:ATP-binding cassette domain-containing protein [Mycoplasma sp. 654]|uniref:ATP-binding cassette domain-containing protein n=1 Tax=Mycoplasma sp. 654 TaxID=3398773 RepID=UPI003A8AF106